jgi:hypothetical protein
MGVMQSGMLVTWLSVRRGLQGWGVRLTQHVPLGCHWLLCCRAVGEELISELLRNKGRLIVAVVDDEGGEEVWDRLRKLAEATVGGERAYKPDPIDRNRHLAVSTDVPEYVRL